MRLHRRTKEHFFCIVPVRLYLPKLNRTYQKHLLCQFQQKEGETTDQFITRFRKQWTVTLVIKRTITFGTKLSTRMLTGASWLLCSCKRLHELTKRRSGRWRAWSRILDLDWIPVENQWVQFLAGIQIRHWGDLHMCFRCGKVGHYAKDPKCPAKGKKCDLCSKTYFCRVVCRSKRASQNDRLNVVHVDVDDEFAWVARVNVVVAGVEITVMIDSGACCSIVDENTWGRGFGGGGGKRRYSVLLPKPQVDVCTHMGMIKTKKEEKKKENKTLNVLGTFEAEVTLSGGKNDRRRLPLNLLSLTEKKMFHCFSGNLQKSWDF